MGTGITMLWFIAAIGYLFVKEKRTSRRILCIYSPLIIFLLFFNPFFAKLFFATVGDEIYFRICWLLPVIIVIAYAAVLIFESLEGRKRVYFSILLVSMIAASGKPVYSNPLYSVAENEYHVPDAVVEICDEIVVPGREVMAVFPEELLLYVRQYSPFVCMPYGREVFERVQCDFYELMEREPLELDVVIPYIREYNCHFVILREGREIVGNPEDYGWELIKTVEGYVIYRNTEAPL